MRRVTTTLMHWNTFVKILVLFVGANALENDPDCTGGTCPAPVSSERSDCGLWLGPSPIKKEEEHGFGLGMFTGKLIRKGSTVESIYSGSEPLLPLYGSDTIYETHPPLREYVWDEEHMPEIAIEYPHDLTAQFIPGLAAIAPCTSVDYNLKVLGTGKALETRDSVASNREGVHRSRHATAGSFAYHHNVTYVAVRDIAPGEELTVECGDDDYDGGAYFLSRFNADDDAVVCLDRNLRVARSGIAGAGRGLFAKRELTAGSTIISTPLIPIHRREMEIDDEDVNSKQLALNYAYGHPDSDLLLLPYGPLVSYLNHGKEPNAEVRWHMVPARAEALHPRQEHHHEELFLLPAEQVAVTHGKSLMLDVVALRHLKEGEEILIDYGLVWQKAWETHVASWAGGDEDYMDAEDYVELHGEEMIRTETERANVPLPENLETFCYYALHLRQIHTRVLQHYSWNDDARHECFRPCRVLERYPDRTARRPGMFYTVELLLQHNTRVIEECVLDSDTIVTDVPQNVIRIVNQPYTTDVFLKNAFRHEIGIRDDLFPEAWKKTKLRRKTSGKDDNGDQFKRKKAAQPRKVILEVNRE